MVVKKAKISPDKIEDAIAKTTKKVVEKIEKAIATGNESSDKPENKAKKHAQKSSEKEIGRVSNYFENVGAAAIKLEAPLKVGDSVKIRGGEIEFEQKVASMQIDRKSVASAKKGDEIGILVKKKVHKGYKVFKA